MDPLPINQTTTPFILDLSISISMFPLLINFFDQR
jgi:hypothetical protein